MEVFQNGPTGQTVVCRVALDSNYVIETVPVLLRRMEDKVVKARILQKGEYVWWDLVMYQVIKFLVLLWFFWLQPNCLRERFQSLRSHLKRWFLICYRNFCRVLTVNGGFSEWSNWTTCSVSCGTGYQLRHRNCTSPPPAYGGQDCESGKFTEGQTCVMEPCRLPGNLGKIIVVFVIVVTLCIIIN